MAASAFAISTSNFRLRMVKACLALPTNESFPTFLQIANSSQGVTLACALSLGSLERAAKVVA